MEGGADSFDALSEEWDMASEEPDANETSEAQAAPAPMDLLEAERVQTNFAKGEADALRNDLEIVHRELEDEKERIPPGR